MVTGVLGSHLDPARHVVGGEFVDILWVEDTSSIKWLTRPPWMIGKVSRNLLPLGGIRSNYEQFDIVRGDKPGAELTLAFEGRTVGAFILAGPDAGIVETSIDGGEFVKQDLFHRFSGGLNYPRSVIFATDLIAGKHKLKLRIADDKNPKSKGHAASILFFEVNE